MYTRDTNDFTATSLIDEKDTGMKTKRS